MTHKASNQQFDGQGALFIEQIVRSGETDPLMQTSSVKYEIASGEVDPEEIVTVTPIDADPDMVKAVREAVKTQHRRAGQTGKHSPLERSGSYAGVKAGDFLPGFGPVKYSNIDRAREFAQKLEDNRK